MVDVDLPRSAGLYVVHGFLPADLCGRLREEAARSSLGRASVFRGQEELVDDRVRRAKGILLSDALRSAVDQRLAAVRPAVGRHFQSVLTAQQPTQLLVYDRGSFFRPHQDNSGEPSLPPDIKARLISAVVFLSRQARRPEPDSCCGGSLIFFGLPTGVRTEVWGEEGLLVAFPATDTFHEVRPVTHGRRYSLVTWFTGPGVAERNADPA